MNFTFYYHLCADLSQQPLGNSGQTSLDVWSARATQGGSEFPVKPHVDVCGPWVKKKQTWRTEENHTFSQSPDSTSGRNLIVLMAGPTFTNHILVSLVLPRYLHGYRDFHRTRHYLSGTLNNKVLQVGPSLSLLYELPPIELCWQGLLSLALLCMHDNPFSSQRTIQAPQGLSIMGKHLQL